MARKDLLKGLMGGDAVAQAPVPQRMKGAIGAVSQSIADLKTRAILEVPADLIDAAGLTDRLDEDPAGIRALADSMAAWGQQVPVLLRHSPHAEGRYEIVYGRRRVAALRLLGLPVKAMVRDLDTRDLVVAQGQENAARKDLTFIEKANFARQMVEMGFERKVICAALHIDKTVISRMLQVAETVPQALIAAIGSAPAAGRDRWLALAGRIGEQDPDDLVAAAQGVDSDARFLAVLAALEPGAAPPQPDPLTGVNGVALGTVRRSRTRTVLDIHRDTGGFADWLAANMEQLHRAWLNGQGPLD